MSLKIVLTRIVAPTNTSQANGFFYSLLDRIHTAVSNEFPKLGLDLNTIDRVLKVVLRLDLYNKFSNIPSITQQIVDLERKLDSQVNQEATTLRLINERLNSLIQILTDVEEQLEFQSSRKTPIEFQQKAIEPNLKSQLLNVIRGLLEIERTKFETQLKEYSNRRCGNSLEKDIKTYLGQINTYSNKEDKQSIVYTLNARFQIVRLILERSGNQTIPSAQLNLIEEQLNKAYECLQGNIPVTVKDKWNKRFSDLGRLTQQVPLALTKFQQDDIRHWLDCLKYEPCGRRPLTRVV